MQSTNFSRRSEKTDAEIMFEKLLVKIREIWYTNL